MSQIKALAPLYLVALPGLPLFKFIEEITMVRRYEHVGR